MKVAILEDEPLAAEKLERYLQKYRGTIEVLNTIPSLEIAIPWIERNMDEVDLFFMDVQLSDGLSFEIFNTIPLNKPVIFTTAFDEFAIDAFKVNSIDYLLKPIKFMDLTKALQKLDTVKSQYSNASRVQSVQEFVGKKAFKDRFLVKMGNHLNSISTETIYIFYAEGRDAYLINHQGKRYMLDYTLETLEEMVNPKLFFRVNRSFLININAIEDVLVYSNRRLKLMLKSKLDPEIIVSREKVSNFKKWFEGLT
ncbi:LytR/AlgR family response regulator transcription factor [Flagellimonas meridianipacifica]|uniref:DNA-binding LytR/AlgR family response regulator n=1 Tax=Flagellimonas meridianipacifica TaxID=1080225 RepID=A0A2T0MBF3_9FLAO|nr:LytTR family DNA-binding domain-containing protein [Allomuricauda pacifica]PRX54826.1 DNA-binding LytR/AlgR family response regulator [Allomuricauda pacifica]